MIILPTRRSKESFFPLISLHGNCMINNEEGGGGGGGGSEREERVERKSKRGLFKYVGYRLIIGTNFEATLRFPGQRMPLESIVAHYYWSGGSESKGARSSGEK
jgi:hypothetical protein